MLPGLKPNAFDKLRKGAEKEREQGRRLGKTEYIEGEAQEWGGRRKRKMDCRRKEMKVKDPSWREMAYRRLGG